MEGAFRRIPGVLILSLLLAASMTAQITTGTISGVVTDPTGAVVPGATATATNVATNVDYTAVSNKSDGAFTVNALPYGFYRVKISAQGFRNVEFDNVQVNVGQVSSVNAKLEVGSSVDTVMVTSELPDVQTESIAMSSAIDKRQIQNLPLNTRNPLDLVKTLPGTTTVASDFFVHGLRAQTVNLMQDGVNVSDNYVKTSGFFSLIGATVDSVSEFTVTSSTADSNSGYGSTQVNLVTTSGTNSLHGSAYWYQRTSYLNANPYFNGVTGLPTPFQLQNRIGYEVGGPVVIPKIYNGKNKTFFFNNFEVFRQPAQQNTNRLVLSDPARTGTFTYQRADNGQLNTVNLLSLGSIGTQKLPAAINSQVMNYYNGLVPSANNDLCTGADAMNLRCFTWNVPGTSKSNRYVGRLDQQIGDKHTASFVYNELRTRTQSDFLNGDYPFFPNSKGAGQGGVRELFSWQFRSNIGNNKTNAASFGIQRSPVDFFINDNYAATGGFQLLPAPTNNPGGTTAGFLSTPSFTSTNLPQGRNTPVWEAVDTFNWVKGRHNLQFGGDYRHVKASNYFFNAVTPNVNLGNNASNPDNLTNSSFPGGISTQGLANAQSVFDTVTGLIGSTTQGFNHTSPTSGFVAGKPRFLDPVQHNFAFFGQDTFKLKPNLTVTLGLRWEYQGVFDLNSGLILQPDNRLQGVFGPAPVGDVFSPVTTPAANDVLLNFAGGNNGKPLYNRDWNNFAPTVGFAWDPFKDGKTAIRAGFATHYTTDGFTFFAPAATGNTGLFSTVTNANTTGVFNTSSVPTPAVPVDQFPVSAANNYGLGTNVTVSNNLVSFNQNLPVPYVLEWNLAVQREVAKNTTVEVRYVGNHGVKLYRATNYNELNLLNSPYTAGGASVANILTEFNNAANNLNVCSKNLTACTGSATGTLTFANMGLPGQVPLPILQTLFTGVKAGSGFSNATFINNLQQGQVGAMFDTIRRNALYFTNRQNFPLNFFVPNPWANSATLVDNSSWSRYNGLELELRRRFASSLSFQFDYTYSKDLTDQRFLPNGSQTDSQSYYTLANRSADKSRAPWDVTQNIAANALYSLPFGRGKRFGGNAGRLLDSLIGGFDIQGVANWATGQPYSILSDRLTVGAIANNTNAVLENMSISDFEKQLGVYKVPGGVFFINPNSGLITVKTTTGANGIPSVSSTAVMCTAGQTTPCFAHPTAGSYGNTPILGFNGPDFFNTDASIIKHIPITSDGTKNFEIRLEAFNVFNHPSFASPTTPAATNTGNPNVISSTTFGQLNTQVDSARGGGVTSRIVQWAIRVNF